MAIFKGEIEPMCAGEAPLEASFSIKNKTARKENYKGLFQCFSLQKSLTSVRSVIYLREINSYLHFAVIMQPARENIILSSRIYKTKLSLESMKYKVICTNSY